MRIKKLNSFVVSLILMTPALITLLFTTFSIPISLSTTLISIILVLTIIFSIILKKNLGLSFVSVIVILLLFLFYLITTSIYPDTNYNIFQLMFYVILPIIISQQDLDVQSILKYNLILSIPLIFGISKMLVLENVGLNQSNMYNTFCFIPTIISSLIYLIYYRKNSSKIYIPLIFLNMYYFFRVSITAVRGFWLVIAFFAILIINYYIQKKVSRRTYIFLLFLSIFIIFLSLFYLDKIILFFISIFEMLFGDNIGIIIKTKALLNEGDIFNGRFQIWFEALNYIKNNIFLGYGIESFYRLTNGVYPYPHNFILQLLIDLGILGIIPIINVLKSLVFFIKGKVINNDKRIMLLLLLTITIPILFFSNDIWKYSPFWFLFGYITLKKENEYE